ncbi:MAG: urease accessory UreF family protein, partial [Pseudomonadota bacterium]
EDRQLGSALLRLLRSLVESGALQAPARSAGRALPLTQSFAAAFAQAAELLELTVDETLAAYAWVWFENQVAAAVKLVPLGQTAGQRILLTCGATLERLVTTAQAVPLAEAGATLAGVALASAAHETQYSRLFRS